MAKEAERLLTGTSWLPEPLRTSSAQSADTNGTGTAEGESLPAFLDDGDDEDAGDPTASDPEEPQRRPVAE
jgi:ParB family transcriptional regulator, chromosome partitioning protein